MATTCIELKRLSSSQILAGQVALGETAKAPVSITITLHYYMLSNIPRLLCASRERVAS
jgi:hypothetical protein